MSVQVKGVVVIDDNQNITNANNITLTGNVTTASVTIYANGVISNVQMAASPASNDAVNLGYVSNNFVAGSGTLPAYGAFDGNN